ncbi:MAG: Alanine--tRNA ligase [Alphaproteobacteria bacterium MarineAlpha5_Bin9]|nr:MAG: Alanine--tRNA ligase [Alphaproteobacteria bacterium MarineAlpha5_Bin9]|tara:strand:+ start:766 stop:1455 length:690 start_codon:yes stop_codon:yes gene_type:complete
MIFLENAYLKEFTANVLMASENQIILDKTAFYARSGGQPGDTGKLYIKNNEISIIDTIYNEKKEIVHLFDGNYKIEKNSEVKGLIIWENRYQYMKMHSALHLLCSLIPYEVTGGQIGLEKSRLDFNADQKIDKENLQLKMNNLINMDHDITYEWITYEQLDKNPDLVRTMSVKPPRTDKKIRLVKIGNIDLQPCGGTHVNKTNEIGVINIGKIENKGKMNKRIYITLKN